MAIQKIKEQKPGFVLFLGGMIDSGTDKSLEYLWQKFDSIVGKLGIPVYDVTSDCRLSGLSISKEKIDLMEKCFLDRYKKRYYAFKYKDNLFIGLDSESLRQGKGAAFENQLNFLKDNIADTFKYNNIFIFTGESPWFNGDNAWSKIIHPLIDKKVKFVFGGKEHYLDARKIGDVTYITTGTPACYLQSHPSRLSFPNFLIIEIEKDRLSMKTVPLTNGIPIENLGILEPFDELPVQFLGDVIEPSLLEAYEREVSLLPQQVIETLKIKPGMDILDLGAGLGFFTFRFADALKGTGKVFATDIDPKMIEFIKNKREKNGYKNVFPERVKCEGVDSFYKQHSFDLIFICAVYSFLRYPEDYFRELKPSLKKGGRLYIINNKDNFDFIEIEIGNFRGLIKILTSKGENFPVFLRLDKDIQAFIKTWRGQDVPSEISKRIINNLNGMLLDRWLFNDLMVYFAKKGIIAENHLWSAPLYYILPNRDGNRNIELVKWLYINLDADGVFDKSEKPLSPINKEQLHKLNKILLRGMLNIYRFSSGPGSPFFTKKESIISTMEKAGYQFVQAKDFLPRHYFLEFKRKE